MKLSKTSLIASAAALAGAAGSAMAGVESDGLDSRVRASLEMRNAQVELYCDHPGHASEAIRRARRQLELASAATQGDSLRHGQAALEQAAWHVRRQETGAALAALDEARLGLMG